MGQYSFSSIGDAIYNKMLEVKNTDVRVWSVFNHDIKIEWWISLPAIIITPTNGNEIILDSCSMESNISFIVRLIDRIQDGIDQAEQNMREVADLMMSRLKELGTITWTTDNGATVKLEFSFQRGYADTQEPIRVFEVECNFMAIEQW